MGWGFVVRGSGPCHIQAVDPSGPAAAVGIYVQKIGWLVTSLSPRLADRETPLLQCTFFYMPNGQQTFFLQPIF